MQNEGEAYTIYIHILHTYNIHNHIYTYYTSLSFTKDIYNLYILYKQLKNLLDGTLTLLVHLASVSIQLSSIAF